MNKTAATTENAPIAIETRVLPGEFEANDEAEDAPITTETRVS
jgi:hypothetical protein